MAAVEWILTTLFEWKLTILAVPTLFLAWFICKLLFLNMFMSPLRNFPGPPPWPFLGNMLEIKRKGFLNATMEWSRKYGRLFVMWLGPSYPVVFIAHPDLVKQVFVTNCYKYNRPDIIRHLVPPLGNSLITSNGKEHVKQRKMLNPAFSYAYLKGMVPFMKTGADDLVQSWNGKLQEAQKNYADVLVHKDLNRLALDVIGESAFGYQFKSVLGDETEVTKAFNHLISGVNFVNRALMALPFYKYLPTEANRQKRNASKMINDAVMKMITERHQQKLDGEAPGCRNLMDIIMDMRDDQTGLKMNNEQLRAQVFTFLLAGHETSSTSMSWTLYELARNPQIQEKIRKEANEVLGDGSDITCAKLDELMYLSNAIKESMRLYPALPVINRISHQEDTLDSYHIPPNTNVACGINAIHRSEKYWPDPESFKPERFEHLTKEQDSMMRFVLMPFSIGPRVCIGNKLAMAEMRVVLASLVQNFTFSLVPGFPEVTRKIALTIRPHPSLQLRIKAVEN